VIVPPAQLHQYLRAPLDDVRQRERLGLLRPRWRAEAEDVREDDLGVFARLERQAVEMDGEQVEEVFFDHARHQLVDLLRVRLGVCWAVSGVARWHRSPLEVRRTVGAL